MLVLAVAGEWEVDLVPVLTFWPAAGVVLCVGGAVSLFLPLEPEPTNRLAACPPACVPLQEFRRLDSQLGAARDRAELLACAGDSLPLLSIQVQSGTGALLRERATLSTSTNYVSGTAGRGGRMGSTDMF